MFIHIQKLLRITKGNSSHRNDPKPILFIIIISLVHMNKYARFDEIPSMTLKAIKETKRYGRTNGCGDGQRENCIPSRKYSL